MLKCPMLLPSLFVVSSLLLPACDRTGSPDPPQPEPIAEPEAAPASASASEPVPEPEPADLPASLPVVELADLEALIAETAERDQVLVIDFWATWCAPCVAMFPDLHEGLKAMGDDVRPTTVTLDDPTEEAKAIRFLADHNALTDAFALVRDSDGQLAMVRGIGERWTDLVVPAILVYDRNGELAGEFIDDSRVPPILDRVRELVEADDANAIDEAQARAHHEHEAGQQGADQP